MESSRTQQSEAENEEPVVEHSQAPDPKDPVNLRRAFPLALRSILRMSIHWILAFVILIIAITVLDSFRTGTASMADQVFLLACATALILGVLLVFFKLVYETLYYHVYYYGVELEHLVISRGIFFKTRASFPLARMADVYVERAPIDMLFLLYNLRITTHSPVVQHGSIEGLPFRHASDLQNYLLAMVNTTTESVDVAKAGETLHELRATEDAGIFGDSPADVDPPRAGPPADMEMVFPTVPHKVEEPAPKASAPVRKVREPARKSAESAGQDSERPVARSELVAELKKTKDDLKHVRQELSQAEDVLGRAKDVLGSSS